MEYTLIRSKRKTAVIQIQKDGSVVVRAPQRLAKKEIDRFVQQKSEWISFHQDKIKRERERQGSFSFLDGRFPLLGAMFPVEYLDEGKPFYHKGTFFLCKGSEEELCAQAQQLYRKIAREELSRRVAFYAQKMGVSPTAIRINGAKGRWGSCSGKNSLNFSWRLMMAPEHAVNYVVVHELCHILHHDHSKEFWQEVEHFFPDWKECRNILAQTSQKPYFMIQE